MFKCHYKERKKSIGLVFLPLKLDLALKSNHYVNERDKEDNQRPEDSVTE